MESTLRPRVKVAIRRVEHVGPSADPLLVSNYLDAYGACQFEHAEFAGAVKTTVGTALKSSDASNWIAAMRKEVESLLAGGTFVPTERSAIRGKHKDGAVDKYKCRLCACSNELWGMIADTYSPTVGALAYATVHQISICDAMSSCIVDVVSAYLHQSYPPDALLLYLILPDNLAAACGLPVGQLYLVAKYL